MAHTHPVYDTDHHFSINPITRGISYESDAKLTLIQGDHNCERYTFDIPRYIEDHDMGICNKVYIHFINAGSSGRHADVYTVEDLEVSTEDENVVYFSWLISKYCTGYAGTLNFVIEFQCTTGEVIDYSWHTGIFTGIKVGDGINNIATIVEENYDILEQWKQDLVEAGVLSTQAVEQAKATALSDISAAKEAAIRDIEEAPIRDITDAKDEAIADIGTAKSEALTDIEEGLTKMENMLNLVTPQLQAPTITIIGTVLKIVSIDSNATTVRLFKSGEMFTNMGSSVGDEYNLEGLSWADGIYAITAKAQASGYAESPHSNPVIHIVGNIGTAAEEYDGTVVIS